VELPEAPAVASVTPSRPWNSPDSARRTSSAAVDPDEPILSDGPEES